MAVEFAPGAELRPSLPRVLFRGSYRRHASGVPNYSLTPDGKRFLMITVGASTAMQRITAVIGRTDE
jgi:hypothetical protein